jgi:Tol biopolymer transport system component
LTTFLPPGGKGIEPAPAVRLDSWKEIASYLGRNERTVQRWEKAEALPIHRHQHAIRGSVYAYTSELDRWRAERSTLVEEAERAGPPVSSVAAEQPVSRGRPSIPRRFALRLVAPVLVFIAIAGLAAAWFRGSYPPRVSPPLARVLVDYPGNETWPAFSPDAKQIAFAWQPPGAAGSDIYVRPIGPGSARRLTTDPAPDYAPRWSPNGDFVAFLRGVIGTPLSVMVVSVSDGRERKVCDSLAKAWSGQNPAWSADGKWLVVPDKESPTDPESLFGVSVETGAKRRLTLPPRDEIDFQPALSPDGASLVFVRQAGAAATDLQLLALDRDLTPKGNAVALAGLPGMVKLYPVWSGDGRRVLFVASSPGRPGGIYGAPTLPGDDRPRSVEFVGSFGGAVAGLAYHSSAGGNATLAFARDTTATAFRRAEILSTGAAPVPIPLLSSNYFDDGSPQFSPDGKRVALSSGRGGSMEIWTASADGSNPIQLTFFRGMNTGSPYWSPDGKNLIFDSAVDGWSQIFRVPAAGGQPVRLTFDRSNHAVPSWSRDGRWIYFASDRTGSYQVWKLPAAGSGTAVMATRKGGFAAVESPDGATLFYTMSPTEDTPLSAIPVKGGEERQILPSVRRRVFAVATDGIYFSAAHQPNEPYTIRFLRFADHSTSEVLRSEYPFNTGLTLSPEARTLIYAEAHHTGFKLLYIDNFQ